MLFSLLANIFSPALYTCCNCLLWMILQIKFLTFSGMPVSLEYCKIYSTSVHGYYYITTTTKLFPVSASEFSN